MADLRYTAAKPGDFFCPSGGTWYVCETGTKFLGCCTADPCRDGCFGDILRPAGRVSSLSNLSPGGSCGGQTPMWTCDAAPTFWGCCNEDPCMNNSTCPEGELEPAFWDRPDQYYYFHDLNVALSSSIPSATAFAIPSSTSTVASSTPTATATAASSSNGVSGAIIGGAVGGSVAFLIIIAAVVFYLCRLRRNKKASTEAGTANNWVIPNAEVASPATSTGFSPPPTYSWDRPGHNPQEKWARDQDSPQEMLGDTRRAELFSHYATFPAELHGGPPIGELESPDNTPEVAQRHFAPNMPKQEMNGLGVSIGEKASLQCKTYT